MDLQNRNLLPDFLSLPSMKIPSPLSPERQATAVHMIQCAR